MKMRLQRRRFLQLLGLGGLAASVPSIGWNVIARAGEMPAPQRLVLWITAHGPVPRAWNMAIPGMPIDRVVTTDMVSRTLEETPEILQPLHAYRRKLLCVEGLAQSTVLAEQATFVSRTGIDGNEHTLAEAHLLTSTPAHMLEGTYCLGGGPSIDHVIGQRTRSGSRWASRVYGVRHQYERPYSYSASGVESPRVETPAQAFADLMGAYHPSSGTTSRDDLILAGRGSALDPVSDEYAYAQARLGLEGRRKLEQHAQLVRELEMTFASAELAPQCELELDMSGHVIDVWNRIATLVLACDLSRVVTFVAPIIEPTDFGYPATPDVHGGYAHSSFDDGGEPLQLRSELAMIEYSRWYADRFARLLGMLDALPEGSGTVLDHANVVWLTELATGTHQHSPIPIVIGGGGDGFFRTGNYIRYPLDVQSPYAPRRPYKIGPGLSRLYVTLMRAMGMADESFGLEEFPLADGTVHSLRGTLAETHL